VLAVRERSTERWEETTARGGAWKVAGGCPVCGSGHASDAGRRATAAEAARLQALAPPEPAGNHDQMPGRPRLGPFRRRT
jgi:hypothetical protein